MRSKRTLQVGLSGDTGGEKATVYPNSAAGVVDRTSPCQGEGPGANPRAALHDIMVGPIPVGVAKVVIERNHYLHTLPGGTKLTFGVFLGSRVLGAVSLGVGSYNGHCLVDGAAIGDCLTLTRLWLSDELPRNSESRVIAIVLRELRKHTAIRFVLSYADPSQGHLGTVYQASGWLYTGLSEATPLLDLGDGVPRRTRTLGHALGTHSIRHFADHGIGVMVLPQSPKHRYIHFVDKSWCGRLRVPVLPYPKREVCLEGH